MSVPADCPGCFDGHHERHDPDHGIRPGLLGGTRCGCTGDCADRSRVRWERLGWLEVGNLTTANGEPPVPAVAPNSTPRGVEAGPAPPEAHRAAQVADRLRALALAEVTAARHGSRVQKAAARAAASAYRLAAEIVEEEA